MALDFQPRQNTAIIEDAHVALRRGEISDDYISEQAEILEAWANFVTEPALRIGFYGFDQAPTKQSIIDDGHRFQELGLDGRLYLAVSPAVIGVDGMYYKMERKRASGIDEAYADVDLFGEKDEHGIPTKLKDHYTARPMAGQDPMELRFIPFNARTDTGVDPALLGLDMPMDKYAIEKGWGSGQTQLDLNREIVEQGLVGATLDLTTAADFVSVIGSDRIAKVDPMHQFLAQGWARLLNVERVGAGDELWASGVYSDGGLAKFRRNNGKANVHVGFFVSAGLDEQS